MDRDLNNVRNWILLPPGNRAICRFAAPEIPEGCQQATAAELLVANQGRPFPWGYAPEPNLANWLWHTHRIGIGGLFHDRWFITTDGRFGGAWNVPTTLPGSRRSCMLLDGGISGETFNQDNEGYAIVRKACCIADAMVYREVQLHAAEHVAADGGAIIVSQTSQEGITYIGFVGRCQMCPNAELVSFAQLKKACPGYTFELLPEWHNWLQHYEGQRERAKQLAAAP